MKNVESTRNQSVELHIEELVLHGFEAAHRQVLADALERELCRLITEQGIPPPGPIGTSVRTIDAGEFAVLPGTKPGGMGTQVAASVYRGLAGGSPLTD